MRVLLTLASLAAGSCNDCYFRQLTREWNVQGCSGVFLSKQHDHLSDNDVRRLLYRLEGNNEVHTLVLNGGLSKSGAEALGSLLQGGTSALAAIDLGNSELDDASAKSIARGLGNNSMVHTLTLQGNNIGPSGAAALAAALPNASALHTLDLQDNVVGSTGARAFATALSIAAEAPPALKTLMLGWNGIGDEGVAHLAGVLVQNGPLKVLDLSKNRLSAEAGEALVDALETNHVLSAVSLVGNEIPHDVLQRTTKWLKKDAAHRRKLAERRRRQLAETGRWQEEL